MKGTDLLYQGQAVTLEEMLQARDKRAARQRQALNCYRLPLISLTLVAPGAVKNSAVWRRVADYAIAEILALCEQKEWVNVWEMQVNERSGPEWMAAVCAPAMALKQHMSTLEMSHPLGRLWDIDIIDSDGKSLSRRELGHPARPCLICQQDAHLCARGKHHPLDLCWMKLHEGLNAMNVSVVTERRTPAYSSLAAGELNGLVARALLTEARLTPKPGLVDIRNSGAHRDMDLAAFERSTTAIAPWMEKFLSWATTRRRWRQKMSW